MQLSTLLNKIKPEWRNQFVRFIDNGEADEAFLTYVDADANAQEAVELAFNAQSEAFQELSRSLQAESAVNTQAAGSLRPAPVLTPARAHA